MGLPIVLIPAIKESNDQHRLWPLRKVLSALDKTEQTKVAVLGLAYKPHTDTLRRSAAVELCRQMIAIGIKVQAYDPLIKAADAEHADLDLTATAQEALRDAHAVIIATEWPEFRDYPWSELLASMARPVVIDANRLVEKAVVPFPGAVYFTVGRA